MIFNESNAQCKRSSMSVQSIRAMCRTLNLCLSQPVSGSSSDTLLALIPIPIVITIDNIHFSPPSRHLSLALYHASISPVIMRHLQPRPLKTALHVEPLIRLATIQNTLVAPHLLRHVVQRLYDSQSQLLSLLILRHRDVLNVSHQAHVVDEFALHDHGARADDGRGGVEDDENVVGRGDGGHEGEVRGEGFVGGAAHGGEDTQRVEEACEGGEGVLVRGLWWGRGWGDCEV
jgi:hypothetical protein